MDARPQRAGIDACSARNPGPDSAVEMRTPETSKAERRSRGVAVWRIRPASRIPAPPDAPAPRDPYHRPIAPRRIRARWGMKHRGVCGLALAATIGAGASAEPIGEVDTVFKLIGPDHKIVVDAYDDPKVKGVTCYVSRAKTGGLKGALGVAEDKAEASIACRQTGPISFGKALPKQEEVMNERLSILFKKLRVVRMVDKARNTLVYLTYSDRLVEGSPQNSVTAVPVDRGTPIPLR
jgi:CreA protein